MVDWPSASTELSSIRNWSGGGGDMVTVPSIRFRPSMAPIDNPPWTMMLSSGGELKTPSTNCNWVVSGTDEKVTGVKLRWAILVPMPAGIS